MKTKEEVIQEAWREAWPIVKDTVDSEGYVYGNFEYKHPEFKIDYEGYELIRPKSLSWLETNNGWIMIESESDLPTDDTVKYTPCENGKPCEGYRMTVEQIKLGWEVGYFTHYRKVESLPYPIY
ncbi:MAG: restriction endonuclease [Caudoviricetes sp.]|nr:MAG: restriction endonuclease [Caudoviricetes sp.]